MVHRDIKPENILLLEGEAMLADFGIALAVSEAGGNRLTETGLSLGTPQYMSPEQATGDRQLDARSDIYSLGRGAVRDARRRAAASPAPTAQAMIAKLMTERPTRLRVVRGSVPEAVDAAVAKALDKTPADRFATAHEFAAALRSPDPSGTTTIVATRMRPPPRTALVVGGVAAVAVLAMVALLLGRGRTSTPATMTRRPLTSSGSASQPALSPDGKMVAYVLKGTDVLVQDLAGGDPLPIVRGTVSARSPRWTPDGSALLFLGELRRGDGGLYLVPRLGGAPRRLADASVAFAVDPAGESVLVSRFDPPRRSTLVRLRLKDGTLVDTLWQRPLGPSAPTAGISESQPLVFNGLEWSPDGRWIAFSATQRLPEAGNSVGIMNASGGVMDMRPSWAGPIQWAPRSDVIHYFPDNTRAELDLVRAAVSPSGRLVGDPVVVMSRVPGLDASLSVSRDGRSAAFISGAANYHLSLLTIDPTKATITERKVTSGTAWHGHPTISPDGRFMVYGKGDQRGDNLYRFPIDSGAERPLTETADWNHRPKISPDGSRLVFLRTALETNRHGLFIMPADGGTAREIAAGQVDWSALQAGVPWTWLSATRLVLRAEPTPHHYNVIDVERGGTVTLVLPDSLQLPPLIFPALDGSLNSSPWPLVPSPTGAGFAVAARIHDSLFVLRASPDLKQWTRLALVPPGERMAPLRWADDDWIYFAHWAVTDTTYWLSRVRATGGKPELRLPIPKGCRLGLERLSSDGRRLVCESPGSSTYDVWIAENFDPGTE